MAVLVKANSVIIRVQAIRDRYTGGWNEFAEAVPNGTLCSDDDEVRVGFMNPDDCESYIASLERHGLTFLRDGQSQDIAVAIHTDGITVPCGRWSLAGSMLRPVRPSRRFSYRAPPADKFIARKTGAMKNRSAGNLPFCRLSMSINR